MVRRLKAAISQTAERKKELAATRSVNIELIDGIARAKGRIGFVPSKYWAGRTDLPLNQAYYEAVMAESYGIDYFPDGDTTRESGFVTAVRHDAEDDQVLVEGFDLASDENGVHAPFSVRVDYVDDNENVLLFLADFGGTDEQN